MKRRAGTEGGKIRFVSWSLKYKPGRAAEPEPEPEPAVDVLDLIEQIERECSAAEGLEP